MCTHVLPAVLAPMWRNYAHQNLTEDEDGRITAYVSVTLFSLILMTLFNVYRFARADALTFSHAYTTIECSRDIHVGTLIWIRVYLT